MTYSFALILDGFGVEFTPEMANSLYEAGCDDALVGCRAGLPTVAFDREAASALDAILSAMSDVRKAGFEVERVEGEDPYDPEEPAVAETARVLAAVNAALAYRAARRDSAPLIDAIETAIR